MSEFIDIRIDMNKCDGIERCGQCVHVCPVNIFTKASDRPLILEDNLDECTLCNLCLNACGPDAIAIIKMYED